MAQQRKAHAIEVASKINEIKQNTVEEIESQQDGHKKKMEKQKMAFERKKLSKIRELASIKMEMTKEMLKAEQEGDGTKCKATTSEDYRVNYCNLAFAESWEENKNCREPGQFCWICCETEYGSMHIDARDACYTHCDNDSDGPKNNPGAKKTEGSWVFIPHSTE